MATLLAGVFATPIVYAGEPDPDPADDGNIGDIWDDSIAPALLLGPGGIYFPWVGNDDESTGLGPADTSVSVMNISDDPAVAFAFVGTHDTAELPDTGDWDLVGPFFLAPWASKTFTAAQLGIAEGTGAPVAFSGYNELWTEGGSCTTVLQGSLAPGNDVNGNGRCTDVEIYVGNENDDPTDPNLCWVDDSNGDPAPTWDGGYSFGGLNNDGDCFDSEQGNSGGVKHVYPTVLGGVAKQAVDGETLPFTTAADSSVSGYNSVGGFELGEFDDWYFPIVQTNGSPGGPWNTILRIANFGNVVDGEVGHIGSAAVTARFFPADDAQGSLDTGFQLQALVNTGDVWHIDVSDYVPEGWVGSVHVYSDSAIFAMADRVKVGYGAWITNTASNAPYTNGSNVVGSASGQYVLFAPDVRLDFYGWNTGINVANLVNDDNNVNIQYFNLYGNAPTALTRRLAPQGMTYFYDPSQAPQDNSLQDPTADVNADIIGSALIWSDYPVAVAVDATKYPESTNSEDPNIFQAMSYSATANVYTTQVHPLVQKGNPTTGVGATSGINIMNPNATAALASVWWVNPSGFGADNYGTSAVAIPGFANGFVYTLASMNLPNGFYGSAVVTSTLPVASVTTQVDYQVEWDGTAVWLGFNPCGYYRDNGNAEECNLGDPFNTQGGQITKYFYDENGEEITGAYVELWNEAYYQQEYLGNESFAGIPWVGGGYSDVEGVVEWTNVPVGTYYLWIGDLPEGNADYMYEGIDSVEGPFTLNEGQDIVIENELYRILPNKYVYLGSDVGYYYYDEELEVDVWLGMEVCLHADDNGDGDLDPDEVTSPEYCDTSDEDGYVAFLGIEPGWYFVSANGGFEYDVVNGFNSPAYVSGAEYFGLGGEYYNYLEDQFDVAEGNIQKVVVLPADFCFDGDDAQLAGNGGFIYCDSITIQGIIWVYGPDGEYETEANVQSEFADFIGPNNEPAFSLTDFNVPVGGPYEIELDLEIIIDHDNDPNTAPLVYNYDEYIEETDDQVICDFYLDPSTDCAESPAAPDIYVYEDQTTRVFNDLSGIITGQFDAFLRDEETEEPLEGAEVCLIDLGFNEVQCTLTGADGQAEFFNVAAGIYSITAARENYETQGSGFFVYIPAIDGLWGNSGPDGPFDDEPGDLGPSLIGGPGIDFQQDIQMALDPDAAILGVAVFQIIPGPAGAELQGIPPVEPVEGEQVRVYIAEPGDEVAGYCLSSTLVDIEWTDEFGFAEFSLDNEKYYCVTVGSVLFGVGTASELAGPPPPDAPWLESPVRAGNYDESPGVFTDVTPFDLFDPAEDVDVELLIPFVDQVPAP
jgi:hypothetical protein